MNKGLGAELPVCLQRGKKSMQEFSRRKLHFPQDPTESPLRTHKHKVWATSNTTCSDFNCQLLALVSSSFSKRLSRNKLQRGTKGKRKTPVSLHSQETTMVPGSCVSSQSGGSSREQLCPSLGTLWVVLTIMGGRKRAPYI